MKIKKIEKKLVNLEIELYIYLNKPDVRKDHPLWMANTLMIQAYRIMEAFNDSSSGG